MVRRLFAVALVATMSVFVVSAPAEAAGSVQVTVTGAGGLPVGLSAALACPAPATPVVPAWAVGSPNTPCSDGTIGVFAPLSGTGGGSFGLAPGTWNVDIVVQHGPLTHHSVTVADGATTPVLVALAELTGSVLQGDGTQLGVSPQYVYACPSGVPGVSCALSGGGARALVNFDGSYRLYLAAGTFDVAPVIGTPVATPANVSVGAGDAVTRNFTVTPADIATVTGTVTTSESVFSTVSACLAPASAPCDGFSTSVAPGATYTLKLGPGTWNLVASASYPTGIASSSPVTLVVAGGDVVTQGLAVPAPAVGTLSGTVRRADGSVPPNGSGPFGAYVFACPSASPIVVGIGCPGFKSIAATGGAYVSPGLPPGSYSLVAVEAIGSIPPPLPPQGFATITAGGIVQCAFVLDGSPAVCSGAAVDVAPTAGDPGTTFSVTFPCTGLATVSLVDPGPPVTVLASGAQPATGAASLVLTVPTVAPGTELSVRARCGAYYGGAGTLSYPPVAFTVTGTPDDGDDVEEPPGYDGNGDDVPDAEQPDVTTVDTATGAGLVTIVAPTDEYSLTAVTATEVTDPPPGVSSPIGAIGFTLHLPTGVSSADVVLLLPDGVTVDSVIKLVGGIATDFTEHATIDLPNARVVLHLTDGGPGDAGPAGDGQIVDPVILQDAYTFGGFRSPIDAGGVNSAKAGQTIPVTWQLTTVTGEPMSDPASFVRLTSKGGECGTAPADEIEVYAPGASGLKYLGDGAWQFNWKTDNDWSGDCRTLTLHLADHVEGRTAQFKFK